MAALVAYVSTSAPMHKLQWLPAAGIFLVGLLLLGAAKLDPAGSEQVAVLLWPGASLTEATAVVGQAGGAVVRAGAFDSIVVAHSADRGFVRKLYAAGALLVANPAILGACLLSS
jgi:hypothetical protein